MKKDLEYYRSLPYAKRVDLEEEDGERYFVARVLDLGGCIADGETRQEALANLKSAFDEYIEAMLEWGHSIPEPEQAMPKARGGLRKFRGENRIAHVHGEVTRFQEDPLESSSPSFA